MKIIEKFGDATLSREMLRRVQRTAEHAAEHLGRPALLLEVCGTHTTVISRSGLRGLLSGLIELRSGPGCPVCVTTSAHVEAFIALARLPNVVLTTFGDMMRVPGRYGSLEEERARGSAVKMVYSPADAVELARQNPDREVVFAGVGFETTAPLVAVAIQQAAGQKLGNFSVYSAHKLVPPVMRALLESGEVPVDGFILPGHVSVVTGIRAFEFIAREFGVPAVVAGFTMVDLLDALQNLLGLIISGTARVDNSYRWVVKEEGNKLARETMFTCFHPEDASWRGLGNIPGSGLYIKEEYARYDASRKFAPDVPKAEEPPGCRCGDLLRGIITPPECAMFGRGCTPSSPVGPCMVSSEGACAAYWHHSG